MKHVCSLSCVPDCVCACFSVCRIYVHAYAHTCVYVGACLCVHLYACVHAEEMPRGIWAKLLSGALAQVGHVPGELTVVFF